MPPKSMSVLVMCAAFLLFLLRFMDFSLNKSALWSAFRWQNGLCETKKKPNLFADEEMEFLSIRRIAKNCSSKLVCSRFKTIPSNSKTSKMKKKT